MVYLFTGENSFEIEQHVATLANAFDGDVERVDGSELEIDRLPDLLTGVTLFSTNRLIVIKSMSQNKPVWAALGEWLERGVETEVILIDMAADKRTKTYKWLEKHAKVVRTKELQIPEAERWVREESVRRAVPMTGSVIRFLVDFIGTDQWMLTNELDKLQLAGEAPSEALIRQIVEPTPQATSFELLDAAFRGQHDEFERLFATVSRQEDPYMFFGLLAGQVFALAAVHFGEGKSSESIAKETGVHPYVAKKVAPLARRLSSTTVKGLVVRLAELDANMKSRPVDPWTQIRSFLHSLQM